MIKVSIRHAEDAEGCECGVYTPKEALDFLELIKVTGAVVPNDVNDFEEFYPYLDCQYVAIENKLEIIVADPE